jgi:hypothetical protein
MNLSSTPLTALRDQASKLELDTVRIPRVNLLRSRLLAVSLLMFPLCRLPNDLSSHSRKVHRTLRNSAAHYQMRLITRGSALGSRG